MLTYDEHGNVVRDKIILTQSNLQTFIDSVKQEIAKPNVDKLFPVGFVYVTSKAPADGGDPNDLFPGTHWTRIEDAYICLVSDNDTVDGPNATPHGSNTRGTADVPDHKHGINDATGYTKYSSEYSGYIGRILNQGTNYGTTGIFSYDQSGGAWYGASYSPNNTIGTTVRFDYPEHAHTIPNSTEAVTPNTIDIQPQHLYRYFWERDA